MTAASRLRWTDALLLIGGYVALDWMSFFHPLHGSYITPWNPAPALALVFMLRYGWKAALPLCGCGWGDIPSSRTPRSAT